MIAAVMGALSQDLSSQGGDPRSSRRSTPPRQVMTMGRSSLVILIVNQITKEEEIV